MDRPRRNDLMENKKGYAAAQSSSFNSYHFFLKSLQGKIVQVYKGGPESKTGRLLDVQEDYICLAVESNHANTQTQTVLYYRTEHLQSVTENSKMDTRSRDGQSQQQPFRFHSGSNFSELTQKFIGKTIRINQGGPESKTGSLLDATENHMTLFTKEDGVVYFNIQHIKSISAQQNQADNAQLADKPDFYKSRTFHQLFDQMSHKWVAINRGGPQALEGVLVQTAGGHYTLINNDEVLRINPYHIKSISCGPKGANKQGQKSSNEQQEVESSQVQSGQNTSHAHDQIDESSSSSSSDYHRSNYRQDEIIKSVDYIWKPCC